MCVCKLIKSFRKRCGINKQHVTDVTLKQENVKRSIRCEECGEFIFFFRCIEFEKPVRRPSVVTGS